MSSDDWGSADIPISGITPELRELMFGKDIEPRHEISFDCPRCGETLKSEVTDVKNTAFGAFDIKADPTVYVQHLIAKHREIVPDSVIAEFEESSE